MIYGAGSPILGQGIATASDIDAWCRSQNADAPEGLGAAIVEEASALGINADIVAAQCMHETGWWRSYAATKLNNPAGIGITNNLPRDQWPGFPSLRAGIHAQVAHLGTYVLGRANPWWNHDPRARFVPASNLGTVRTVGALGGTWAVPGVGYGDATARLANDLIVFAQQRQESIMPYSFIRGLIDIRGQLPTNDNGGPGRHVALSEKRGAVIHYSGPPVELSMSDRDIIHNEAAYHCTKDWDENPYDGSRIQGSGLMYHIVIGRNGEKWLCRDIEEVLWHCGAWPYNATALAIHIPIGGDQRATPAALQALREVCDDWFAAGHGDKRRDVWGHQELSPTSCPGTLMQDFVLPYREGMQKMADGQWFPETKHYLGGGFYQYWLNHGGLAQFGYPLTDEIPEVCEDGELHTVQYFERAVFEWHPKNRPPYDILLRRLGAAALATKG